MHPRKNVARLIEAFIRLKDKGLPHKLVITGSLRWKKHESIPKHLKNKIRTKSKDDIIFTGTVDDPGLIELYRNCSVFVYPSLYEGFGLPALEAMHCGCPVIASDRSSLPEVVGRAGVLLDPTDVAGWADAIKRVLEVKDERRRLVSLGRAQAAKFSWRKTALETMAVYERCR